MKKILESFKKYKKDYILLIGVILIGLTAVLGTHFSDVAKTKFWWTFWDVATIVSMVSWVGGWLYLNSKDKQK